MSVREPEDDLLRTRAKQLFRFLKALADRNTPTARSLSDHQWVLRLDHLPRHPSIQVGEVQIADGQDASGEEPIDEPLIRVRRPKLTSAPAPPKLLSDWLQPGWQDPGVEPQHVASRPSDSPNSEERVLFDADASRIAAFNEWRRAWLVWAEGERPARQAMSVFERLYELYGRIEREAERVELILGDGRLRWRTVVGAVDHPVLLQRVELEFDPDAAEFRILDSDRTPELYAVALQQTDGMAPEQLAALRVELEKGGYHPLAKATAGYFRRLVQLLSARGEYREALEAGSPGPDPVLARDVVLLLRQRSGGFSAAFDRVLEDLEKGAAVPVSISRLVGVEPEPPADAPPPPMSPWAEPEDVLLSKPANAEQIAIARAIERHRAVLVQGPPGTGKSHTIANLIGHLVAHGKRVLVTSHTTKALRVLRGHVVKELQPLCVAVLENDLDGRAQMEQAVRGILSRITASDEVSLAGSVRDLRSKRLALIAEIERITTELQNARGAEYRSITVGAEAFPPSEAGRWVRSNAGRCDWIPGPVEAGAPLPLAPGELAELYSTNVAVSPEEEAEIRSGLPAPATLPLLIDFEATLRDLGGKAVSSTSSFWERAASEGEIAALEKLLDVTERAVVELSRFAPWQQQLIKDGQDGTSARELWRKLRDEVEEAAQYWGQARPALIEHGPQLASGVTLDKQRAVVAEIMAHFDRGGTLTRWSTLFRGEWRRLVANWRIRGEQPTSAPHFEAISRLLEVEHRRVRLSARWVAQAEPVGFPEFRALGTPLEPVLLEYGRQFEGFLGWWNERWNEIQKALREAGFRWQAFRVHEIANSEPLPPFDRDVTILTESLPTAVRDRLILARGQRALKQLAALHQELQNLSGPVCERLKEAVRRGDARAYDEALRAIEQLRQKAVRVERRSALLARLEKSAPIWAATIARREGRHGAGEVGNSVSEAWRWIQLSQELDRRAALEEAALSRRLYGCQDDLRAATARLIDSMAWLGQVHRTSLKSRQALQGWADTQKRIGKGTGKRAPQLQAQARKLLNEARGAVPVWIMPLARVAESFGPSGERFDVVIIDEASQSDVLGLLAWYLGERVVVVGDHEQVSPLAVGQDLAFVQNLIAQDLAGIPNNHLYDGTLSVYHLARQSFGGAIALREHFRCVPDIIEFSNYLAYNGEIRPLRNPASAPQPHLIECTVPDRMGPSRAGGENIAEARLIAAIVKVLAETEETRSKTMGAITLLGDAQAFRIQELAAKLVGTSELERRRFVAGNSAQYQGDERDVMLLSMVDVPEGAPLPLKARDLFKERYNVAASRARDQMWLIHSLDPDRDLKAGDLRRSLIEHFRNPRARRVAIEAAQRRAESPFEAEVAKRLLAANYRVASQQWVGHYRLDFVVSDGIQDVAVECDGDRFHGFEELPADMARQAVLERAGWKFIRIRGTQFYRDPEGTMGDVFEQLSALGILPVGGSPGTDPESSEFREKVLWKAWEVMKEQKWVEVPKESEGASPGGVEVSG